MRELGVRLVAELNGHVDPVANEIRVVARYVDVDRDRRMLGHELVQVPSEQRGGKSGWRGDAQVTAKTLLRAQHK
jgi:hypothetical protein